MRRITMLIIGFGLAACAGQAPRPKPPAEPLSARTLFERGQRLAARGQHVRAEQYLRLSVQRGYPETRAVMPIVAACLADSRLRAALAYATRFLARHPRRWRLRLLTATLHGALGHPERALAELKRVLVLAPGAALPHYHLGLLLDRQLEQPKRAREHFQTYLRLEPQGPYADAAAARLWEPQEWRNTWRGKEDSP